MTAFFRPLFFLLAFSLVFAFYFVSSLQAASVDDLTFEIIEGKAILTYCDQSAVGSLTIPSSYKGYPVTRIAYRAINYCSNLTEITLPNSLLSIGTDAFDGTNVNFLTSGPYQYLSTANAVFIIDAPTATGAVEIPATIEGLPVKSANAFSSNHSITSVTLLEGITEISDYAFYNCSNLNSVSLPDGITHIRSNAFAYSANLNSVNLPESLQTIGVDAFSGTALPTNTEGNLVFLNNNSSAFVINATSVTGAVEIPANIQGYAVKSANAFKNNNSITSVTLPEGITEISPYAFANCENLISVTLPSTLTHIGERAFNECSRLANLVLPENLLSISNYAFYNAKLSSLHLGASVSGIGNNFIEDCDELTSIEVDPSNSTYQSIDGILYNKVGDTLLLCPPGRSAPVFIPDEVTAISPRAFYDCAALREVEFGSAVLDIGEYAFYDCASLNTVVLNSALQTIGDRAFYDCEALKFIELPNGLQYIGKYAFYRCNTLTDLVFPNSLTTISDSAFYECSALTAVNFPTSLVSMGESVFSYCKSIRQVQIPSGITEIPYRTFNENDSLSAISIPASVEILDRTAFSLCYALNHFYFEGDAPASINGSIDAASQPKAYVLLEHADSFGGIGANWYGLTVVPYEYYLMDSVQGRGRISGNARTYSSNASVTLNAIPEAGSVFIGWRGDITSDSNPLSININSNLAIEAVFVEQAVYNSITTQLDSDGDGLSNTFEATPDSNALNNLGYYSASQIADARPGSVMLQKSQQGDATLSLQIERSSDLENWTQNQEDRIEVAIPLDQSREFLRFSMDPN
jgi:hypothetical protein